MRLSESVGLGCTRRPHNSREMPAPDVVALERRSELWLLSTGSWGPPCNRTEAQVTMCLTCVHRTRSATPCVEKGRWNFSGKLQFFHGQRHWISGSRSTKFVVSSVSRGTYSTQRLKPRRRLTSIAIPTKYQITHRENSEDGANTGPKDMYL